MSEADFLKLVIDLAKDNRVTWFHDYNPKRNPPGLPDLILAGRHHLIWRELKLEGLKPEKEQVQWKYSLLAAGQDYKVWHPSDYDNGSIESEIQELNIC